MIPGSAHADLSGRTAVITGGASGIGYAVAAAFRARGAAVVVADLQGDPVVDVTDAASVGEFARSFASEHESCDFLVTAAGTVAAGPVDEVDESIWDRLLEVNLKGVWRMVTALLPRMAAGSSVVTVSSGAGLRPTADVAAYAASKAAVIGYTRALAVDLAPREIRVNCVAPGVVDTPMHRAAQAQRGGDAAEAAASHRNYLVKRDGTAEEIADAVLAVATNGYITGATLAVDGGRALH